jgi:hypothetical protein
MNNIVVNLMSNMTSSYRFSGYNSMDLRSMATNLVLFPRMHFLIPFLSPLDKMSSFYSKKNYSEEVLVNLFNPKNALVKYYN